MRQHHDTIDVRTTGLGLHDITEDLARVLEASALHDGLATLLVKHTSASLTIQENADPSARRDLERFLERLVPEGDEIWTHVAEGPDDAPSHVRAALTSTTLGIPFRRGRAGLGTWQGIYLWEHRRSPRTRRVSVHLIGD